MSSSKNPAAVTTSEQAPLLVDGPADDNHHTSPHDPTETSNQLATSNLVKFRNAIGINVSSPSSNPHELESARLKPTGLYKEVIHLQRCRYIQYYIFEYFYYGSLISQILIGSILTAIGSLAMAHPRFVSFLGGLNTSIAAIAGILALALMKGQVLPDQIRKDAYEMKKVQDFIEETDIRLAIKEDIHSGDLLTLVEKVFEMYNTARDTAKMNHPSNYVRQTAGPESPGEGQGQRREGQDIGRGVGATDDKGVGIGGVNRVATSGSQTFVIS